MGSQSVGLILAIWAVAAGGLSGCFAAPEHCHGCRSSGVDGGNVGSMGGATGVGGVVGAGGAALDGGIAGSSGTGGTGTGGTGTGGTGVGGAGSGGTGAGGAGTGGMGTGGMAAPIILSIDFVGGESPGALGTTPMTATEAAGVKSAINWNSAPGSAGTASSLVLSSGTVTAASATWSSPSDASTAGTWRIGYTDAPGNVRMMNGYLDPALPATISVTGLPAAFSAGGYDVYVYASGDVPAGQTRTSGYSIATASFTVAQTGPFANPFPGFSLAANNGSGNYVRFQGLTGTSFTLRATPMTLNRAPVNGLQIVAPSGS